MNREDPGNLGGMMTWSIIFTSMSPWPIAGALVADAGTEGKTFVDFGCSVGGVG